MRFEPDGYTPIAYSRYTSVDGHDETERWVSIWINKDTNCKFVDTIETTDLERTACARVSVQGKQIMIYGIVLPWQSDKWHCFDEKRAFRAALMLQSAEWRYFKDTHSLPLIVAGDFNQDLLLRTHYYGSKDNKELLKHTLKRCCLDWDWDVDFDPVATQCAKNNEHHATIDHICVSKEFQVRSRECWPRTDDSGKQLTDHFGSLIETELIAS
jgi:exonuclease III